VQLHCFRPGHMKLTTTYSSDSCRVQ